MKFKTTKTVRLDQGTVEQKREEIKQYFLDTFELEESLYSLLKDESEFLKKANPLRHPLIFYYGHTHTFFVNKLYIGKFIAERIDPHMESLVAVGVDEMSWDDLGEERQDWPSVESVKKYRDRVRDLVLDYISTVEFKMPIEWDSPMWPILMGIEHQRIHIETSSVLIRELPLEYVRSDLGWPHCQEVGKNPENQLLPVRGEKIILGKDFEASYYGWDNEYGTQERRLKSYEASRFLVSNGEYLEFLNDGGYEDPKWWTEEGKKWKSFAKTERPHFWFERDSGLQLRVIDKEIPLPMAWPVEVNYLEAKAFCNWKSDKTKTELRLPTEGEWYLLRKQERVPHLSDWEKAPGNINLEHFGSSCPVTMFKSKDFYDVVGNVWQWTETPIYPYQGFKVHPLYDDFTVPTFDNRHNLIKGGSWISTGNEALPESRYAFRRHFFQHAGFRYVKSDNPIAINENPYETDTLLSQYCEFHYGDEFFGVPNFPKACIEESAKYFDRLPARKKALDLGCAVGRSTFELSRHFEEVIGLDFSARFIAVAQKYYDTKVLRYSLPTEGELAELHERKFDSMNLPKDAGRVNFFQADACNLPSKYSDFDFVFCGNLIDRLVSPRAFLRKIHEHMSAGGILVLTSPYTWLEEFTPKSEWIGGLKRAGENIETLKGLEEELLPWFERIGEATSIPFVIRETKRKFQHTLSEHTVWKKKS
ncbi:MAG: 5-histidylcysteine sulfoxide synthase [Bdellovibrionales bacterium]|nr:5-histidylcysteine sulfoxide synthase [Bdellovibrionales bacterium]